MGTARDGFTMLLHLLLHIVSVSRCTCICLVENIPCLSTCLLELLVVMIIMRMDMLKIPPNIVSGLLDYPQYFYSIVN